MPEVCNRHSDILWRPMDNRIKGKKLLILAGAEAHSKVVQAAQELGVYTIVTDYLPVKDAPAKKMADQAWMLDIRDVDAIVDRCRKEKVDGVLAFCIDPAQIPYQKVCQKLGVPCYGNEEQFEVLVNKRRFKDYCLAHGVDVIPEYTEEDVKNRRVIYPVLVKPSDSRGSRGQTVCYCREEIYKAIDYARSESSDGQVLIERYMLDKQDISFAYIVMDSNPYLVKMGDRYLGKAEDNLERQNICTFLPSDYVKIYKECVEPKVINMITSLGIKFGAVYLQGFIDGNKVYFYDPGLRFPGSDYDIALFRATGFSTMKCMIQYALSGEVTGGEEIPKEVYNLNGEVCIILSVAVKPGVIAVFDGLEELKKDARVCSVMKRYDVGEMVPDTGDLRQRAAELVAILPSRDAAMAFVEYVYEKVTIKNHQGEDMILSKMERSMLHR